MSAPGTTPVSDMDNTTEHSTLSAEVVPILAEIWPVWPDAYILVGLGVGSVGVCSFTLKQFNKELLTDTPILTIIVSAIICDLAVGLREIYYGAALIAGASPFPPELMDLEAWIIGLPDTGLYIVMLCHQFGLGLGRFLITVVWSADDLTMAKCVAISVGIGWVIPLALMLHHYIVDGCVWYVTIYYQCHILCFAIHSRMRYTPDWYAWYNPDRNAWNREECWPMWEYVEYCTIYPTCVMYVLVFVAITVGRLKSKMKMKKMDLNVLAMMSLNLLAQLACMISWRYFTYSTFYSISIGVNSFVTSVLTLIFIGSVRGRALSCLGVAKVYKYDVLLFTFTYM